MPVEVVGGGRSALWAGEVGFESSLLPWVLEDQILGYLDPRNR